MPIIDLQVFSRNFLKGGSRGELIEKHTLDLTDECMNSIALRVAGLRSYMDVSCLIIYMSKQHAYKI